MPKIFNKALATGFPFFLTIACIGSLYARPAKLDDDCGCGKNRLEHSANIAEWDAPMYTLRVNGELSTNTYSSNSSKNKACKSNQCSKTRVISKVPVTLTKSGKYCVNKDLTFSGTGNAITVAADNVTINFANHNLVLTDPSAIGIFADGVSELTIENDKILCTTVSNDPSGAAIRLENVNKAIISNVFTQNTFNGILLRNCLDVLDLNSHHKDHVGGDDASGVRVSLSSSVTIDGCTIEGSSGAQQFATIGIRLGGSQNIFVKNSQILNSDLGIFSLQISDLQIENCFIESSPDSGLTAVQLGALGGPAQNVLVQDTVIRNQNAKPGYDGMVILSGSGCLFENVIFDVNTQSISGYTPAALHLGCLNNGGCLNPSFLYSNAIFRNCVIKNTNDVGILFENASSIILEDSQISQCALANLRLDTATECVIKNCDISNSSGDGIVLNQGANNNSILGNVINHNYNGIVVNPGALNNYLQDNKVFDNIAAGINNLEATTVTYFNTSCNNGGPNCNGVSPSQTPGASPAVAGSNICCP